MIEHGAGNSSVLHGPVTPTSRSTMVASNPPSFSPVSGLQPIPEGKLVITIHPQPPSPLAPLEITLKGLLQELGILFADKDDLIQKITLSGLTSVLTAEGYLISPNNSLIGIQGPAWTDTRIALASDLRLREFLRSRCLEGIQFPRLLIDIGTHCPLAILYVSCSHLVSDTKPPPLPAQSISPVLQSPSQHKHPRDPSHDSKKSSSSSKHKQDQKRLDHTEQELSTGKHGLIREGIEVIDLDESSEEEGQNGPSDLDMEVERTKAKWQKT